MSIRISTFRWVPPAVQGLVRDLRVRWALEEAGLTYEERLVGRDDLKSASYRRLQPFGQVPAYEEDGLMLFESGAIVRHIAERSEALLPSDPGARARATTWMFAALNTVEPPIVFLLQLDRLQQADENASGIRPTVLERVQSRLASLAEWLGGREYLEDRFTAGDLLMTTVLEILRNTDLVAQQPVLEAYRTRCAARPGYQKALADQLACYAANAPAVA